MGRIYNNNQLLENILFSNGLEFHYFQVGDRTLGEIAKVIRNRVGWGTPKEVNEARVKLCFLVVSIIRKEPFPISDTEGLPILDLRKICRTACSLARQSSGFL